MLLYSAELRNLSPAVPQGVGVMLDWQAGVLTLQFEDKGKVTGADNRPYQGQGQGVAGPVAL